MADPTLVNGQITDAITQTNVKVLGEAPAQSMALVYQAMGFTGMTSMQNTTNTQYGMQTVGATATGSAVAALTAIGTAGAEKILNPVPKPISDHIQDPGGGFQGGGGQEDTGE